MRIGTMALLLFALACAGPPGEEPSADPHLDEVQLFAITDGIVLPGSTLLIQGDGFLPPGQGSAHLHLRGDGAGPVDLLLEAVPVDAHTVELRVDEAVFEALGGEGARIRGAARVEVEHRGTGARRASNALPFSLEATRRLAPRLSPELPRALHVNDPIPFRGEGLLLGGEEGRTWARLRGCTYPAGSVRCDPIEAVEVPIHPARASDRGQGVLAFAPEIAGIRPVTFRGALEVVNEHGALSGGGRVEGDTFSIEVELRPPELHALGGPSAGLGRYVHVAGAGFVGASDHGLTLVELTGSFRSAVTDNERSIDAVLVPEVRSGREARYVMSEDDALGGQINLRREHGALSGTLTPVVRWGDEEMRGAPQPFDLTVEPVRQVVFVAFQPSYAESLRHFGLRAAEPLVRERLLTAAAEVYEGVGLELRDTPPEDHALYTHVDVAGPDPNGQGLFGYDNTPGKDTNNLRLHDRIGGVNATTQADGYPGYGGIFVDSFLGFSEAPGEHATRLPVATPLFDAIFDPFRRSRGGRAVTAEELSAEPLPDVERGAACPAAPAERRMQIACAVWTLGNLVGSTLAHELGHSLGLAYPDGDGFHNIGDAADRLMDSGGARPFEERAVLGGQGPAVFCDEELEYLWEILPPLDPEAVDDVARPGCY